MPSKSEIYVDAQVTNILLLQPEFLDLSLQSLCPVEHATLYGSIWKNLTEYRPNCLLEANCNLLDFRVIGR